MKPSIMRSARAAVAFALAFTLALCFASYARWRKICCLFLLVSLISKALSTLAPWAHRAGFRKHNRVSAIHDTGCGPLFEVVFFCPKLCVYSKFLFFCVPRSEKVFYPNF